MQPLKKLAKIEFENFQLKICLLKFNDTNKYIQLLYDDFKKEFFFLGSSIFAKLAKSIEEKILLTNETASYAIAKIAGIKMCER